jgi:non-ribosomal peptide synthetase-like protein
MAESSTGAAEGADYVDVLAADADASPDSRVDTAEFSSTTERAFAGVLAEVLGVERVPVDGHVFDDLGADSMVMARFCARVRKRPDLPQVSMKDVYQHPTVRSLATAVAGSAPAPAEPPAPVPAQPEAPDPPPGPTWLPASRGVVATRAEPPVHEAAPVRPPGSTRAYLLCGALQLLVFVAYVCLSSLVAAKGYEWISSGRGLGELYLRSVVGGGLIFVAMSVLPIAAKWLLIGRWKPREIRIWSLGYVRFWLVASLVRTNFLVRLTGGSPILPLYLRALGAHVGRGVVIMSRSVPVCTDLLTIGDGTVIRKDCHMSGYRAQAGWIQTGAVTLGKDVVVAEATVIDIETSIGDGGQLGRSSSLHPGQAVPAGERWHGSPARPTDVDYRTVGPARCGRLRRTVYCLVQLIKVVGIYVPLAVGFLDVLLTEGPNLAGKAMSGVLALAAWRYPTGLALGVSFVVVFVGVLAALALAFSLPRALAVAVRPDTVHPLYGFRYGLHQGVTRLTNLKLLTHLFGDSSYIVTYLKLLGYDLSRVEQTGSNFGTEVKHDTPYLSSVGQGTMVADGLSIINADVSSTSFRLSRVSIGARNFLGNRIAFPSQGRTGDNCLLATKVLVPVDGKVRENVGLLGSPSFEIPRTVERDARVNHPKGEAERLRRLRAKNLHNLQTIGFALLVRWGYLFGVGMLAFGAGGLYRRWGWVVLAAQTLLGVLFTTAYFVLVERAVAGFRPLRPQTCSIYEPYFWWHERYWKLVIPDALDRMFAGTPFKNVLSRLLGVRLGKRVFDDGCFLPERTLVTIGDDVTLNAGSVLQSHSQEDGAFKSDRITIGSGCTIGMGGFVHYGVTMNEDATLAADSFLMKGEDVPAHTRWGGNPAEQLTPWPSVLPRHASTTTGAGRALPQHANGTGGTWRTRPRHANPTMPAARALPQHANGHANGTVRPWRALPQHANGHVNGHANGTLGAGPRLPLDGAVTTGAREPGAGDAADHGADHPEQMAINGGAR